MKRSLLICLLILNGFRSDAGAAGLGININFAERGGTFVDVVKEEYRWSRAGEGGELSAGDVDEFGWPNVDARFVADYRPAAEWAGSIDDPDAYRIDVSGTYKCCFTGSGSVRGVTGGSVKNKAYNASANLTTFDFIVSGPPGENHGLIIIDFTETKRTSSDAAGTGFTGFRMLRPGYDLSTPKTFTDEFIKALTDIKFSTIRFMNFSMTNGRDPEFPGVTTWADRKKKEDASQSTIPTLGKTDGGAWEYVIELCNLVHMDPWINIPVSADSEYVREVAKLFREGLESSRALYVESSNEVWNTAPGFEQSLYSQKQAKALGIGEHTNHARRTVEIAGIFGQEFGTDALNKRVRVILCSHKPMLKWWVVPMLDTIADMFGPPKDYIHAIACQTYFGGGVTEGESVDNILSDCRKEIEGQIDEPDGQSENHAGRVQWVATAKKYGLEGGFCSYEGGPDHGGGSTNNIANRIRAERDARMADIWTYNYDSAFFQVGGNLAMQFTLSSAYTRYGCWGLTDDITDPARIPKYNAAKALAEKYPAAVIPRNRSAERTTGTGFVVTAMNGGLRISRAGRFDDDAVLSIWNVKGQLLRSVSLSDLKAGDGAVYLSGDKIGVENQLLLVSLSAGGKEAYRGSVLLM